MTDHKPAEGQGEIRTGLIERLLSLAEWRGTIPALILSVAERDLIIAALSPAEQTVDTTKLNAGQLVQCILGAIDGDVSGFTNATLAEHIAAEILDLPKDYWQRPAPATEDQTCYIERSRVREICIGVADEHVHIAEIILNEIDKLPIVTPADLQLPIPEPAAEAAGERAIKIAKRHTANVLRCVELNGVNGTIEHALLGCEIALAFEIWTAFAAAAKCKVTIPQKDFAACSDDYLHGFEAGVLAKEDALLATFAAATPPAEPSTGLDPKTVEACANVAKQHIFQGHVHPYDEDENQSRNNMCVEVAAAIRALIPEETNEIAS